VTRLGGVMKYALQRYFKSPLESRLEPLTTTHHSPSTGAPRPTIHYSPSTGAPRPTIHRL